MQTFVDAYYDPAFRTAQATHAGKTLKKFKASLRPCEELFEFLRDVDVGLADQLAERRAELEIDVSNSWKASFNKQQQVYEVLPPTIGRLDLSKYEATKAPSLYHTNEPDNDGSILGICVLIGMS
ncbi:hypothetical protein H2199_008308 [Coniosporium tulheliwenetii]|uniref:Uncharacterized protein n=1 Tax=Coniosporium tulheliwenetii TaxID=3383036 RepID=A0ACC2YLF3_9PEZI|nr:hypothetical protein H2199_008308 [Cladosporium sp. JES 115]